jgi:phosphatidylserine/phosphatidylglycerophosphate/cardiolipin synthase-like enzyme
MPTRSSRQLDALGAVDRGLGAGIERLTRAHHRRRLRRNGWTQALDAPAGGWAAGDPPPREGSRVEVLIDGAVTLRRIAQRIASARSHVHIAGWHLEPSFELVRGEGPPTVLGALLAERAEYVDVRVLLWAGAPVPLFHPTRAEVRRIRDRLCESTKIVCALDRRERPMHCHHEKTIVIDDEIAFVGGIDLTDLAGDRYDTSVHNARRRIGWHDVATELQGPVVFDVATHFLTRWRAVTGETLPAAGRPAPGDGIAAQIVRTVPNGVYDALPRGDFRILETYQRALRAARRFIYIENQFLWSPEIVAILRDKLRHPPTDDFRIVTLLPARPNNGQDDTRGQLSLLAAADDHANRFLAVTIRSLTAERSDPLYVHAKVAIVDDEWLIVGSANLNEHSLFNDTEMCVVTRDNELAIQTRTALWSEHLECDAGDLEADPIKVIDTRWRPIAQEQLRRHRDDLPATHRLIELPGVSKRADRLRGPLSGLLNDG